MKRQIVYFFTLGIGILLKIRSDYERNRVKTEFYQFHITKCCRRHRVVFLTDLHEKMFGKDHEKLLNAIRKVKPEAVFIGGDMVLTHKKGRKEDHAEHTASLLEVLKKEYPVYYAYGNHEQRLFRKAQQNELSRCQAELLGKALDGVHVLDDSCYETEDLRICGIGLDESCYGKKPFGGKQKLTEELIEKFHKIISAQDSGRGTVCMIHSPMYLEEAVEAGADLVLSGHFHGGTIRLPLAGGIMTPQFQFFLPECSGIFRKGTGYMLVSRGLGTHSINIRLNNLPELCVIDLLPEEQ